MAIGAEERQHREKKGKMVKKWKEVEEEKKYDVTPATEPLRSIYLYLFS